MNLTRRIALFFVVFAADFGLDQLTKHLANAHLKGMPTRVYLGDLFRLGWATNDGAFLSLGGNLPPGARYWLLTVGVGLLLLGITVYALTSKVLDAANISGYALIASGGFCNWVDRVRFDGAVVDFMNLGIGSLRTGIFNVADLAIIAGIVVLFLAGWKQDREKKKAQAAAAPPAKPA